MLLVLICQPRGLCSSPRYNDEKAFNLDSLLQKNRMECPPVSKFKTSIVHQTEVEMANMSNSNIKEVVKSQVERVIGPTCIKLLIPNTSKLPGNISQLLNIDQEYYLVHHLSLSCLIEPEFLANFTTISSHLQIVTTTSNRDNTLVTVTSGNILTICLDRNMERLGQSISQVLGQTNKSKNNRYLFKIDLKESDKLKKMNSLRTLLGQIKMGEPVEMRWSRSDDSKICPSSLARYMEINGMEVEVVQRDIIENCLASVDLPTLVETDSENLQTLENWMGMVMLGVRNRTPPWPDMISLPCLHSQTSGLFSTQMMTDLVMEVAKYMTGSTNQPPFIFITIVGDQNESYMPGGKNQVVTIRDQLVTVLLQPSGEVVFKHSHAKDWGQCKASKYEG